MFWNSSVLSILPTSDDPSGMVFSKLILASSADLERVCVEDQQALEEQLRQAAADGDDTSVPFIEQGLVFLQDKLRVLQSSPLKNVSEHLRALSLKLKEKEGPVPGAGRSPPQVSVPPATPGAVRPPSPITSVPTESRPSGESGPLSRTSSQAYLEDFEAAFSEDEYDESDTRSQGSATGSTDEGRRLSTSSGSDLSDTEGAGGSGRNPRGVGAGTSPPTSSSSSRRQRQPQSELAGSNTILFYQAEDGQPIFAQQFILKALLADRGTVEYLPDMIEAKILEIEETSQTQEHRKKHRATGHLPLTAELSYCELDLKASGLISPETYRDFQGEIKQRDQRRRDRARREEQESRRKERHDLNNFDRYQRFLESYSESFPAPSPREPGPQDQGFPLIGSPPTPAQAPAEQSKTSTSPTKGNYAGIVKGASAPERPIFSDHDFVATLSDSVGRSSKGGRTPDTSASLDFPSLASTSLSNSSPTPSQKSSSPWGKPVASPPAATATPGQVAPSSVAPLAGEPSLASSDLADPDDDRPVAPGAANGGGSHSGGKKGKKKTVLMSTASQRRY